jgi:serine O-acetyltransferase
MNSILCELVERNTDALIRSDAEEYCRIPRPTQAMPSVGKIKAVMKLVKAILFPGFFDEADDAAACEFTRKYHIAVKIEKLYGLLNEQIQTCLRFNPKDSAPPLDSARLTATFVDTLPEIKRLLATDIKAICDGDPAATNCDEVIFCYPSIQAMIHYRTAHELLKAGVLVLPRIITEFAHSLTGIDIHPGARIGEYFSIDHGTGVVIGETCIIGNHVRLYQGVTLGARSLALNEEGLPEKKPRHPIIEDNVIVYSNSTILGRITIGHDSIIGGNVWQVYSVPPHSRIIQKKAVTSMFTDGLGI